MAVSCEVQTTTPDHFFFNICPKYLTTSLLFNQLTTSPIFNLCFMRTPYSIILLCNVFTTTFSSTGSAHKSVSQHFPAQLESLAKSNASIPLRQRTACGNSGYTWLYPPRRWACSLHLRLHGFASQSRDKLYHVVERSIVNLDCFRSFPHPYLNPGL